MNRKVNLNRPEISSEEILKRKNFDSVLKQAKPIGAKPLFKKPWFLSSVVVVSIAVIVTAVLLNQNKKDNQQLAENKMSTADSLALEMFYTEQVAKPCISPPIAGLNIEYTSYKIIAEKGAALDFKTGSKIKIPKNAFADEKGNFLKGEIELRYREFHDAADFFVSGIPMTYDSAGVKYQFESAGMIEVLAYQNGNQVKIAPKKTIEIEMASSYKGNEYNLYKLDTIKNNWSCLGKDRVLVGAIKPVDPIREVEVVDIKKTPEYKTIETKKVQLKNEKEVQMAALKVTVEEPKKPNQVKKGKYTFNIEVDANEFPELSVYKGLLFEVGDENTNFNKSMYDITWDEASIKEGNKTNENYNLTLKKGLKKYDLVVYPVFEGSNYEKAVLVYKEKFNKYKVTLDKRIAEEKRVEEVYLAKLAKFDLEQKELVRKMKEKEADNFKQMDTNEKVKRMFAINSFGVFNSDCPSSYPKGVLCTANLKNESKKNLRCYDVYLVDKNKNGLFTYSRNPITSFSFNPESKNLLWTVEDGVLYWLKPEQFNSINSSVGSKDLIMNKVDQKFTSVDELKVFFNF